jgi:hypothetical protein
MSTHRPSSQKFEHIAIVAVVGAFTSVALVCLVLAMRHPVLLPIGDRIAQPSPAVALVEVAPPPESASQSTLVTPPPTEISSTLPLLEISSTLPLLMSKQLPITLSDAELRDIGISHDHRAEAAAGPPPSSQRASRRHWPRHSVRAEVDHGEAARLMAEDLRQRGVAPVSSMQGARSERRSWRAMRRGEGLAFSLAERKVTDRNLTENAVSDRGGQ